MLAWFAAFATLLAGLAHAPWWFWLVGGAALALLSLTDPRKNGPSFADLGAAVVLAPSTLASVAGGCLASATAFAAGRMMSWALLA